MKNEINLWRVVDFLLSIDSAKSLGLRGKMGYVGAWVVWVEFLHGSRGLRGLKYFFTWIIIFTWFAWVKIFFMCQFFFTWVKIFCGRLNFCVSYFLGVAEGGGGCKEAFLKNISLSFSLLVLREF